VICYGGVTLVFDKDWLENLIKLQKISHELSEKVTWPKEFVEMVMQAIQISLKNPASFYEPSYFGEYKSIWNAEYQSVYEDNYGPKINITETDKGFLVKAAIPGLKDKSDICVKVTGNTVNISGKARNNSEKENVLSFNKNIPLPAEIDSQKATAKYSDGILTLYLPKIPEANTRQIEITFI